MTRLEALTELLAKVGADDIDALPDNCFRHAFAGMPTAGIGFNFSEAHEGSLDAAKALHESVLPGWDWCGGPEGFSVYSPLNNDPIDGDCHNPARAWLIAILKALIAQEKNT